MSTLCTFPIFSQTKAHPSETPEIRGAKPSVQKLQICTALFLLESRTLIRRPFRHQKRTKKSYATSFFPIAHRENTANIRPSLPYYDMPQTSVRAANPSRRIIFCEFSSSRYFLSFSLSGSGERLLSWFSVYKRILPFAQHTVDLSVNSSKDDEPTTTTVRMFFLVCCIKIFWKSVN